MNMDIDRLKAEELQDYEKPKRRARARAEREIEAGEDECEE